MESSHLRIHNSQPKKLVQQYNTFLTPTSTSGKDLQVPEPVWPIRRWLLADLLNPFWEYTLPRLKLYRDCGRISKPFCSGSDFQVKHTLSPLILIFVVVNSYSMVSESIVDTKLPMVWKAVCSSGQVFCSAQFTFCSYPVQSRKNVLPRTIGRLARFVTTYS